MISEAQIYLKVYPENSPILLRQLSSSYPFSKKNLSPGVVPRLISRLGNIVKWHFTFWKESKLVGLINAIQIDQGKWGLWNTYIEPDFRGLGYSKEVYLQSFRQLKQYNARIAIGSVSVENTASLRGLSKYFDGFYDTEFLDSVIDLSQMRTGSKRVTIERVPENEVIKSIIKYHKEVCDDLWYNNWGIGNATRDFRSPLLPSWTKYLLSSRIFCDRDNIESGYLAVKSRRFSKFGFGLLVPGKAESAKDLWDREIPRILCELSSQYKEFRLMILRSPKLVTCDPGFLKSTRYRIAYSEL